MLADVLPTPLPGVDFLYFGPLGGVLLVAAVALAIVVGRAMRRRGRSLAAAIAVALLVFVAADALAYLAVVTLGPTLGAPRSPPVT